jgi:hypothetical protein
MNKKKTVLGVVGVLVLFALTIVWWHLSRIERAPDMSFVEPDDEHPTVPTEVIQPLNAEQIAPVIRASGRSDETPDGVVVEFAIPVASPAEVNRVAETIKARIEPEVSGEWNFTGSTTLRFSPKKPFRPSTRYTVTLDTIDILGKTYNAPRKDAWRATFETPSFGFVRASLRELDRSKRWAKIDLVFSGPVAARDIGNKISKM